MSGHSSFVALVELGVTYRQLDYWCRTGVIALESPGSGSGTRRAVTPIEVEAIKALVAAQRQVERQLQFIRSGDFFEAKMNELTLKSRELVAP